MGSPVTSTATAAANWNDRLEYMNLAPGAYMGRGGSAS